MFYLLQKLECVICLRCNSCILIFGHFSLHKLTLYPKRKHLAMDCGIEGFLLFRSVHIQAFNIYSKEARNTQKQYKPGCKEHNRIRMSEESTGKVNMLRVSCRSLSKHEELQTRAAAARAKVQSSTQRYVQGVLSSKILVL